MKKIIMTSAIAVLVLTTIEDTVQVPDWWWDASREDSWSIYEKP